MEQGQIIPVILSGGAGSRLWPLSRKAYPKQLLPLVTDKTMVQETALRLSGDMFSDPVFICNADHAAPIHAQMNDIAFKTGALIIEPMGRNTAPCAVTAALYAKAQGPNTLVLLAPADHHVTKPDTFRSNVKAAVQAARDGYLVTFGITPTGPETGYGYIEMGEMIAGDISKVKAFREKPDQDTAQTYLEKGGFAWNAGIFLFSPDALLSEIQKYAPEILEHSTRAFEKAERDGTSLYLDEAAFALCPSDSIDYAIMEPTDKAAVIPVDIGWSDIGSYSALHEELAGDNGNALMGDITEVGTQNCLIQTDGPMVSAVGLENIAIIVKDNSVLVLNLDKSQDVKKVVETLKSDPDRIHLL